MSENIYFRRTSEVSLPLILYNIYLYQLYSIISDPVVSFERKKPFSRLLTRAYLNTERDSLVSISDLCSNE